MRIGVAIAIPNATNQEQMASSQVYGIKLPQVTAESSDKLQQRRMSVKRSSFEIQKRLRPRLVRG